MANQVAAQETASKEIAKRDDLFDDNPFLKHAREVGFQSPIVGELLRFNKGDWLVGKDGEVLEEGKMHFIANMSELASGWVRWEDQKPIEQLIGKIIEGHRPPKRSELGDTEPSEWPAGNDGKPMDPWVRTDYLLLKDYATDDLYTLAMNTLGGLRAMSGLSEAYGKAMRAKPGQFPVISLHSDSYKHSNPAFGRIKIPVIKVVGWAGAEMFGGLIEAAKEEIKENAGVNGIGATKF